jgi:hypothetical protein
MSFLSFLGAFKGLTLPAVEEQSAWMPIGMKQSVPPSLLAPPIMDKRQLVSCEYFQGEEGLKAQRLFLLPAPELFAPDRLQIGLGANLSTTSSPSAPSPSPSPSSFCLFTPPEDRLSTRHSVVKVEEGVCERSISSRLDFQYNPSSFIKVEAFADRVSCPPSLKHPQGLIKPSSAAPEAYRHYGIAQVEVSVDPFRGRDRRIGFRDEGNYVANSS